MTRELSIPKLVYSLALIICAPLAFAQNQAVEHEQVASPAMTAPAAAQKVSEETWNAYGQYTYIWQRKDPFAAAYTNLNGSSNSLVPGREHSFTETATA